MRLTQVRSRRLSALGVCVALLTLSGSAAFAAAPEDPKPEPPKDVAVVAQPSVGATTLTRGASTVTVSRTAGLTRQTVSVSWTGMEYGQSSNPVLVMQCRGSNPAREDCWIGNFEKGGTPLGSAPMFANASYYEPEDTAPWYTTPPTNPSRRISVPFKRPDGGYVGFRQDNGTWSPLALGYVQGPGVPDVALDDVTPGTKNFRRGQTRPDGTGQIDTWLNTAAENPSLACSEKSACSLVVVPVRDLPCKTGLTGGAAIGCARQIGLAGAGNWQLLGNWYQRYVFNLSFAPTSSECQIRDDSAKLLGSELVGEAMRRWTAARCQQSSSTGLDFTRSWEPDARRQLGQTDPVAPSGYTIDGAVVSEPAAADDVVTTKRKPGYAPVAISGFAIGYTIDNTETGAPVNDLKLNQRLVAKLLTQSYPGRYTTSTGFPPNPNASTNPQTLLKDPEFQQLNPTAAKWAGFSGAVGTQLALPVFKTDVFLALTRWIWSDSSARSFLQGKPDQWGMSVNKAYRGWVLPRDDYEQSDGWSVPEGDPLAGYAPQSIWAQPTNSWANGADVLMTAWPLSQGLVPLESDPTKFVLKREQVQFVGFHSLLAVSTTSELAKSGMQMASLRNAEGEYVAPDVDSMTYALDGATADRTTGVWKLDYNGMDKRGYPGTMVSYAAVPTATLKADTARRYADTLRYLAGDGQQYGQESGQLPDGYLALTEPMRAQTTKVADAVENQTGQPPVPPEGEDPVDGPKDPTPESPGDGGDPNGDGQNGGGGNGQEQTGQNGGGPSEQNGGTGKGAGDTPGAGATPTAPGATPSGTPSKAPVLANGEIKPTSATTQGESLGWLAWGIPALLAAGLAAGVASPGIRVIAQPGHPVRRGLAAGGSFVAGLFQRRGRHG